MSPDWETESFLVFLFPLGCHWCFCPVFWHYRLLTARLMEDSVICGSAPGSPAMCGSGGILTCCLATVWARAVPASDGAEGWLSESASPFLRGIRPSASGDDWTLGGHVQPENTWEVLMCICGSAAAIIQPLSAVCSFTTIQNELLVVKYTDIISQLLLLAFAAFIWSQPAS